MANRLVKKYNMSPRTAEQFDQIRQEKKELITSASLELFAANGYHATSISQIAKKAGISKGLIYNYFDSKNEILNEIINNGFKSVYKGFDLNHDSILTREEFVYFLRQSFSLVRGNPRYWKLFYALMLQPKVSDTFKDEYLKFGEPLFKIMSEFIVSMGSTDPEGDLMVVSAIIEGALLYCTLLPEVFTPEILEEKTINAIFRLIQTKNKE